MTTKVKKNEYYYSPSDFIQGCDRLRADFFAKYPAINSPERQFWSTCLRYAHNAVQECVCTYGIDYHQTYKKLESMTRDKRFKVFH